MAARPGRAEPVASLVTAALALAALALVGGLAIRPASGARAQEAQPAPTGAANLNVSPRRVIFTPRERTAAVYIFNQGTAAVTVDVALVDNVMLPSGEIVPVEEARRRGGDSAEYAERLGSAAEAIIATPSRLSLPAGGGRTVRLRALMPEGDAPQELRTHLTVTSVPPADAGLTAEQAASLEEGELRFSVQTIFGISIPLFIRSPNTAVSARLGPIAFAEDPPGPASPSGRPVLVVPVLREGTRSVFGNLEVRSGSGRDGELLGTARGIGVYTELDRRDVRVPLLRRPRAGEALTVTFIDGEADRGARIASESFTMS